MNLTIAFLPDASACDALKKTIEILSSNLQLAPSTTTSTFPHISTFQLKIEACMLASCIEVFKKIAFPSITFNNEGIQNTYQNISFKLQTDKNNRLFQERVKATIASFLPLRSHRLMEQVNLLSLNPDQRALVKKYGIYWNVPPEKSKPHMTLLYHTGSIEIPSLPIYFPPSIACKAVVLAQIDGFGNIERIVARHSCN